EMNVHAGVTIASGSLEAAYARKFSDYKQADVATKIRIPKLEAGTRECCTPRPASSRRLGDTEREIAPATEATASGPFAADGNDLGSTTSGQTVVNPQEVIAEIRVHGNAYLKDEEVIRLAGIALGQAIDQNGAGAIEQRLKASGYFDTVEVRKRYRSLDAAGDVAIVLLVHERPGQTAEIASAPPSPWPWRRFKSRLMFLPIVGYDDGYGFTYGGRVSTVDLLGAGERLSVPLTWGGTRRAAIEFERTFKRGPVTRIESTFGIAQRENPRFEIDDRRVEWTARAERSFARLFRTGIETSQGTVAFDQLDDRTWTLGADAALDTRGDPAFPRNAVYLGVGWNGLHVRRLDQPINRWTTDARGYLGLIRQAVLAGRVQYSTADRTLPPYERLLLGGASTLRGFDAGAFDGDRMLVTSAELRVPLTSVLNGAKLGVIAFMDAGKAFDVGQHLDDAAWHRGVGGGVFLIATIVRLNLDVAHGLKDGDTRVHFSAGFNF
ncbi:MAG TPA: FtsQ-type POTRA domain-containing protein, partial [Vicinamibacterales bacterium]|nr:FtsQ-type POTRA domain-containing protein [Vicinamibacterales bacterium]